jgi:hypothetical protein
MHWKNSLKQYTPLVFLLLCISTLIFGGILRGHNLGEQSLWIDEGYSINAAQAVIDHGYPTLDSGEPYRGHILSTYIIAGSMQLFGFDPYNPWSARLPAAIFGILGILMTYIFTLHLFNNKWLALASAMFVAFLPWEVAWSRQARGYTMMQFFILFSFDQLLLFSRTQKIKHSVLSTLGLVAGYLGQGIAVVFFPAFFFSLAVSAWVKKQSLLAKSWWPFWLMIVAGTLYILPSFANITSGGYLGLYTNFVFHEYSIFVILALLGVLGMLFYEKEPDKGTIISTTIIFTFLVIAIFGSVFQPRYLIALMPFIGIGAVYGVYLVCKASITIFEKKIPRWITCNTYSISSSVFIIIMITLGQFHILPQSHYSLEIGSPQPNFKDAYTYITNHKNTDDVIISPYAHLTKIYTGETGILLPISLTGRTNRENYKVTQDNKDYYTGAEILNGVPATLNMIENSHGYVILDSMARNRIGKLFTSITNHPKVTQVHESDSAKLSDHVWIYEF